MIKPRFSHWLTFVGNRLFILRERGIDSLQVQTRKTFLLFTVTRWGELTDPRGSVFLSADYFRSKKLPDLFLVGLGIANAQFDQFATKSRFKQQVAGGT